MPSLAKEFMDAERRKMRLQATLAAKRNSLMTIPPGVTVGPGTVIPRQDTGRPEGSRAAADATIRQNQADVGRVAAFAPNLGSDLPASQILNAANAKRIAATVAHNNLMRPGRIADANARLLPERGLSQGAIDSLYEDRAAAQQASVPTVVDGIPVHPGAKNAGVAGNRSWLGQYLPDSWRQSNFNQQAIDEQTYGAGQRFPGGGTSPWTTPRSTPRSASQGLADSIKQIKKRAGIIRGTVALVGGDTRAADRYEAKAMASLGIYAGEYAMSQLTDADFQSKQKLFQALRKNGMPIDQIIDVIQSGVADAPTTKLKDQQKQVFIDADGKEHAGKIAWDDKGGLRYLKRDGTLAPDDWVPRQASSKQPINIGVSLGEKPDIAVKKSMIKRAALMMAEAKKYWIDEDGKLRDELDLGDALGWKGPARTTKSKMKRALSIALRLESGAAIGEDERAQFYDLFMPNYKDWLTGDREAAIIDKFDDFQKYIEMIVEAIDPSYSDESIRDVFHEVLEQAKDDRRVLAEAAKTALTIEEKKELEKLKQIAGED
jgi:hypothetical protein